MSSRDNNSIISILSESDEDGDGTVPVGVGANQVGPNVIGGNVIDLTGDTSDSISSHSAIPVIQQNPGLPFRRVWNYEPQGVPPPVFAENEERERLRRINRAREFERRMNTRDRYDREIQQNLGRRPDRDRRERRRRRARERGSDRSTSDSSDYNSRDSRDPPVRPVTNPRGNPEVHWQIRYPYRPRYQAPIISRNPADDPLQSDGSDMNYSIRTHSDPDYILSSGSSSRNRRRRRLRRRR